MVNAGLIQIAVADDWLAKIWAEYLPDLTLHPDLAVRTGGQIGWAVRKQSPKLRAVLDAFIANGLAGGLDRILLAQAAANAKRMHNATGGDEMKPFPADDRLLPQVRRVSTTSTT